MFDQGSKENFMQLWKRLLPMNLYQTDETCQHIEFYLIVYFTIFPVHPANPKGKDFETLKKRAAEFKLYLDSKGSDFASSPEFLSFYALPYIKNPQVILSLILGAPNI